MQRETSMLPGGAMAVKGRYPSRRALLTRHAADVEAGPFARTALEPPRFLTEEEGAESSRAQTPACSEPACLESPAVLEPASRPARGAWLPWVVVAAALLFAVGVAGGFVVCRVLLAGVGG